LFLGVGGFRIQKSQRILVVGAPLSYGEDGAAFVYKYSLEEDEWNFLQQFKSPRPNSNFGQSVGVPHSSTLVVIGAPALSSGEEGSAYIYATYPDHWQFELVWQFQGTQPGDLFGYSVAGWGSLTEANTTKYQEVAAVIGAPGVGQVHIYDAHNNYSSPSSNEKIPPDWIVVYNQTLTSPSPQLTTFGISVACEHQFSGGHVMPAVGSPSLKSPKKSGEAYSLRFSSHYGSPYVISNTTVSPDGFPDPWTLGWSIAVQNGTALVGGFGAALIWCTGTP